MTKDLPNPPNPSGWEPLRLGRVPFLLALLLGVVWLWRTSTENPAPREVEYSTFYGWAREGKVESVTLSGQSLRGKLKEPEHIEGRPVEELRTSIPDGDTSLLPLLLEEEVRIQVVPEQRSVVMELILSLLPWALILGIWVWLARRAQRVFPAGPLTQLTQGRGQRFEKSTATKVTFEDIAGLSAAKEDLQEVVQFLQSPDRFQQLGAKIPRGVLRVGPPGTGKTLLARAVAGESDVPFYSISASEFIEMFVGLGAARVRALFEEARRNAPAIIFIDEIDAVGRARGAGLGNSNDEREQTLNQLLSEMDGFRREELVVVLAATNRPDVLDPALLRPGRFDRRVFLDRPELAARRAILGVHTRGKPLAKDVDLQALAESTTGFSGADLANLVNEAALHALRARRVEITAEDLSAAYDKLLLGAPREARLEPGERRRVAVHEAGHAVAARFSPDAEPLRRVTILPRGMALGATQQAPPSDRHLTTQPELLARLRVLMGGYAAERLLLGSTSTGAESDLKEATELAMKMAAHYGMSERLGPVYYEHHAEHPFLGQRIATDGGTSDATVHAIEEESRALLSRALDEVSALLRSRRSELDKLIAALLEQETLEPHDLLALFKS